MSTMEQKNEASETPTNSAEAFRENIVIEHKEEAPISPDEAVEEIEHLYSGTISESISKITSAETSIGLARPESARIEFGLEALLSSNTEQIKILAQDATEEIEAVKRESLASENVATPIGPEVGAETQSPVQEQANYMGNYSELVFSRLQNQTIKNQLLDLLENNEKWLEQHPPMVSRPKKDAVTGEVVYDDLGLSEYETVPGVYTPKSREQLENDIDMAMAREMASTKIDFGTDYLSSGSTTLSRESSTEGILSNVEDVDLTNPQNRTINIGVKRENSSPLTDEEIRELSIIEAHEKGHVFRLMRNSGYLEEKFAPAFDVEKVNPENYFGIAGRPEGTTDEQVMEAAKNYLFNFSSPHEIIERMSQLKCYFEMKNDEKFTPAHLEYAREHYIKDGMIDNHMQALFESITPETTPAFIELINSAGI